MTEFGKGNTTLLQVADQKSAMKACFQTCVLMSQVSAAWPGARRKGQMGELQPPRHHVQQPLPQPVQHGLRRAA